MNFIKKQWKNILFFGLIIFMFTPQGMPLRALLIKGVSYITSRVETLEIDPAERQVLSDYNWQLVDMNKKPIDFNQYKGQVIVLNNWATWCPPCVAELPSLEKLYKQYGDKVTFLFVAQDKFKKVQAFINKNEMQIPVFFPQSAMPNLLESSTIPTTFIIDKSGAIVVRKSGAADWNSGQVHNILDKLLAE